MELAVVGNKDFVLGFRLAGIRKIYEVNGEINPTIQKIMKDKDIGIIVMHNKDFENVEPNLKETLSNSIEPTFVILGAETDIRDKIKQAVGVDLWKT
ncbi:MAG TPA: V-type ATP synthase subunit F [Methanosarcinales archaeon]|nr:V-type ATP synthase subunit F [Methanosarcinales archaeon]